jgi:Uma2 family endonuclease
MKQTNARFTYHDYLQLSDDKRCEIVEGELLLVPSPSVYHQTVLGNLFFEISQHVRRSRLGTMLIAPCDVVLSPENVVQPDLLFVSNERRHILAENSVQGAPDLVVEVLSRGTKGRDLKSKRRLYSKCGIKEYWIVDPDARIVEVLSLIETGYRTEAVYSVSGRLNSALFPELNLSLDEIF